MNLFFTADPHYYHNNILKYCSRPFKDVEEMHETLIKNYNYYVKKEDTVFWLGDIGFYEFDKMKDILNKCNGIKILLTGNHDKRGLTTYYKMGFSAVLENAEIKIGKNKVTMAHYPRRTLLEFFKICRLYIRKMFDRQRTLAQMCQTIQREWKQYRSTSKSWHLHGHCHTAWKIKGRDINVGVDMWDFKPVAINEIAKIIEQSEKGK